MRANRPVSRRTVLRGAAGSAALAGLAACSGNDSGGATTITIEGPNQWTDSGSSFGPAWDKLIAKFEKANPGITVKTVVLPISQFLETISTQLSAATAPELVFNQAPHESYMVYHLDDDLQKPNPFVPGNKAWIDLFDPKYFTPKLANVIDEEGHVDWLPFNLFTRGIFYNEDAFAKAGVTAPITTFADLIASAPRFKAAGYTPFAMDNGNIGMGFTYQTMYDMMMIKYFDRFDYFDAAGDPGKNSQITAKDVTRAVLSGKLNPRLPEVAELFRLLKQFSDTCCTPNWSGIAGNSGTMAGIREFVSGKAAMAWGTDYTKALLAGSVKFSYDSMPFPTITKESSSLSTNYAARCGLTSGATSYMIPAKTSGDRLAAAITFLQWMSVGSNVQTWLDETGAVPAVLGAKAPPEAAALTTGVWAEGASMGAPPDGPSGQSGLAVYEGYLLGSKSLAEEQGYLADVWRKGAIQQAKTKGWSDESWAGAAK